ncbi:solute carrier family 22 member 6-like [Portunus trituberculatus]|uniref:solute carrier family 22 member 6-like n=1 Tax=Portunus trituberculatus TaxID=210409 RepID=UPI001E1D1FEB|nr:solute carrier family 22 member 6-like [Portunus trituberculatus]XP_045118823.1 solute carrier family 22 member 6-like [Portunus trituberculatus]XP_045118824.1 solute carrier family 22 member 6-like [Portunus trituberculatus]
MKETTRWKEEEQEEEMNPLDEEMDVEAKKMASKLTSLEDIVEELGPYGRWNVCLFLLCSSAIMFNALITMSYQFLGATPDHWCRVESLKEVNWTDQQILDFAIPIDSKTGEHDRCHVYDYNYTEAALLGYDAAVAHQPRQANQDTPRIVPCSARDFNLTQHESSVVTEWDLVCERRVLYATTQAVNQLGFLIASLLTPILADRFGRRPVALCMMCLILLLGLGSLFSSSVDVFIAFRCGMSTTMMILYLCCFIIMMEWTTTSTRSSFGSMTVTGWAVGCMLVPGIAYLIRPWRYLQAAFVLPYVAFFLGWRFLPESPRWLLLHGRYEEVENTLATIAATNRSKVPPRGVLRAALTRISQQMRGELGQSKANGGQRHCVGMVMDALRHVLSPYISTQRARKMCLLIIIWFSASSAYYGLSLNATNISADPYLYNFLHGVFEVPAYFLLWLLVARAGRRPSLSVLFFFCAICIAINSILMFVYAVPVSVKIILSLLGKMSVAAAFHLAYLFTAELFTTQHRSLAVCHCCLFGRIGSIASPYINDILGEAAEWAPSAVFAVVAFISSLLALLLPETRNKNLPENNDATKEEESRP